MAAPIALADLNALPRAEFVRLAGTLFEHSPWVADRVADLRPFASGADLHRALCGQLQAASAEEQVALIRAHPDLVGRAVLTRESRGEQAAAGLENLAPGEAAQFADWNAAYREKFGFPFVICARLNRKEAIQAAFPRRLENSAAEERATALREIEQIARLRLEDLLTPGTR